MPKLEIGQRYRKVSSPSTVWEVVAYRTDRGGIPHVRLVSTTDQTRSILMAESLFARSNIFEPVAP
jgi:hypothetical protein